MKTDDMVYVNFPTGKGGPYEVIVLHFDDSITVLADGVFWNIAKGKYEPIKPELEEGRLYYTWDNNQVSNKNIEKAPLEEAWDNIEPVHRRWNELSLEEIHSWLDVRGPFNIYKEAYKLITGEEHP
jgi:hypothetical protein